MDMILTDSKMEILFWGVKIPSKKSLVAHSDGDIYTLYDALLGVGNEI